MPSDLIRKPGKFNCTGIDLAHPVDMMPDGYYPFLQNARSVVAGTVECRPGYSAISPQLNTGAPIHSLRRVNNLLPGSTSPNQLFAGSGTSLYAGPAAAGPFTSIATGFSGDPLSSVIFRPDQSPESWIYIADKAKMVKASCEQVVRNIGIAPPNVAPTPDIATVNNELLVIGNSATGWTGDGTVVTSPPTVVLRVPASSTVSYITYDNGTGPGWATISPQTLSGNYSYLAPGAIMNLNGVEDVVVQDVTADITTTTIAGIIYDGGGSGPGPCSISLAVQTPQLVRNSYVILGFDNPVRVTSVTTGPDGLSSFRCSTISPQVAGNRVISVISFRAFTTTVIAPTNVLTAHALQFLLTTKGTGYVTQTLAADLTQTGGRPLQPDDYLHISFLSTAPGNIVSGQILFDVDSTTNDFTRNYYYANLSPNLLQSNTTGTLSSATTLQQAVTDTSINAQAAAASNELASAIALSLGTGTQQWTELLTNLSQLVRVGTDTTRSLANIAAIRLELVVTAATTVEFCAIWAGGTYGPDVQQGSPVGISYQYRYRDSRTGAKSVPSPPTRYQLFPERQAITVGVTASTDPQVDTIDIQRFDPGLGTLVYVGSTPNATGNAFLDDTQASLIAGNLPLETNVFQPWPTLAPPLTGFVNVAGTSIQWVSGAQFPTSLEPGTIIQIGGSSADAVQTYGQPYSPTSVHLVSNLNTLTNVPYTIASPTLLGQPLPIMFGPLEGPTAIFAFGIGDPLNPGTLYWSNGNDLDSANDSNFLEVTSPSEPLVSGTVWQTLVFVASAKRVFLITPSFGTDSTGAPTIIFTSTELTSISGCFSPWGMVKGSQGVYMIGRDGLYQLNYNSGSYFSQQLYPLFPHDGEPAVQTNSYNPVLMTNPQRLRLRYCDAALMFDYDDTGSNPRTFEADPNGNFWPHVYGNSVLTHYWEEVPEGTEPRMLMGTSDGYIMAAGGTTDNGSPLFATIRQPSMDFGDPRSLKLFMDLMNDADATGGYTVAAGFNNYSTAVTLGTQAPSSGRQQYLNSISSVVNAGLVLYRNIAMQYIFGAGTILYESEPSYYLQPFYSNLYTTQLMDFGIPGWKQCRYGRIAVISVDTVEIQILNDDGVLLADFTVPSSSGILFNHFVQIPNATKGRLLRFSAASPIEFVLFPEKTFIRMKKWGGQQFLEVQPFLQ